MTSNTPEWATPQDFFDEINKEFNLEVDVCADKTNSKCLAYWNKQDDGLSKDWSDMRCWMNPPYGREIGKWIKKAATGGGRRSCLSSTGTYGHPLVSRLYIQQSRDTFYKGSTQIWWMQKLRPFSIYGCNF